MTRACALIGAVFLFNPPVHAQQRCPMEFKLLLSAPTTQTVIASLKFKKEQAARIYFFDTSTLDLSAQGMIIRVRQGAKSDLTVKARLPAGSEQVVSSGLLGQFPCEIDRNQAGAMTSYAVGRPYDAAKAPDSGTEIYSLLSPAQKRLLNATRVRIDWTRVIRVVEIASTSWQTTAQSTYGKLALELWEWPAGRILELSAKAAPEAEASGYAHLEALVKKNKLSLSGVQDTKTSLVLDTVAH
jgi:hypothetical protein